MGDKVVYKTIVQVREDSVAMRCRYSRGAGDDDEVKRRGAGGGKMVRKYGVRCLGGDGVS